MLYINLMLGGDTKCEARLARLAHRSQGCYAYKDSNIWSLDSSLIVLVIFERVLEQFELGTDVCCDEVATMIELTMLKAVALSHPFIIINKKKEM